MGFWGSLGFSVSLVGFDVGLFEGCIESFGMLVGAFEGLAVCGSVDG